MSASPTPRSVYSDPLDRQPLAGSSGVCPSVALEGLTNRPLSRRQLVDLAAHLDVLGRHDDAARVMAMHDSATGIA